MNESLAVRENSKAFSLPILVNLLYIDYLCEVMRGLSSPYTNNKINV